MRGILRSTRQHGLLWGFGYARRRLMNVWYTLRLRLQGVDAGRNLWFEGPLEVRVDPGGKIIIGDGCNFGRLAYLKAATGATMELKANVKINRFCVVESYTAIVIENDVMTGPSVFITDGNHNFLTEYPTKEADLKFGFGPVSKPVRIGAHAWIGNGASVLPGVTVGEHAVVGAGSVVTKDIPSHAIAAGVPCRVLRYRRPVTRSLAADIARTPQTSPKTESLAGDIA